MVKVSYWKYGCSFAKLGLDLLRTKQELEKELGRTLTYMEEQGLRRGYLYGKKTYEHFDAIGM